MKEIIYKTVLDKDGILAHIKQGKYRVPYSDILMGYTNDRCKDTTAVHQIKFGDILLQIVQRVVDVNVPYDHIIGGDVVVFKKENEEWFRHRSQRRGFIAKKMDKTILGYLTEIEKFL